MNPQALALLPLVLLAAGLATAVALFIQVKKEVSKQRKNWARQAKAWEATAGELRTSLEELRYARESPAPPAASFAGLTMQRRGQVLRMHHRGERPEQIAVALGIPLNEIQLLIRLQEAASAAA